MGQYFMWLNPVKGQYFQGYDFDHGGKRRESAYVGCPVLEVLYTLLASDWKGDPIVWIGDDYARLSKETNRTLKITEEICGRYAYDHAHEHFVDIAIDFADCDREWIVDTFNQNAFSYLHLSKEEQEQFFYEDYTEEGITFFSPDWDNRPAIAEFLAEKGFFSRKTVYYRYVLDHTRKEYFDRENTELHENGIRYDPFPVLMIKEDDSDEPDKRKEDSCCGLWLGDMITLSNDFAEIPADYEDVSGKYLWENGY